MKWSTVNNFGRAFRVLASALALSLLPPVAVASTLPSPISSALSTREFKAVPANKKVPVISGTLRVPNQLSVSNGTWTGGPTTFTHQWLRCSKKVAKAVATKPAQCTEISGATASTYTLTDDDASKFVIARVGGSNASGGKLIFTPTSTETTPRVIVPKNTVVPAISGTAQVSRFLTVSNGTWIESPEEFSYQWYRCTKAIAKAVAAKPKDCVAITGATESTHHLVSADSGKFVTSVVTSSNTAGSATASFIKSSAKVAAPTAYAPSIFTVPTMFFESGGEEDPISAISGAASLGSVLVASKGQWLGFPLPEVTYSYWYRCDLPHATASLTRPADCYAISGSNGSNGETYLVSGDDVGKYLAFEVIALNNLGTVRYFTGTTDTATAIPSLLATPILTGAAEYGQTLSVSPGQWSRAPGVLLEFAYSWYRCDTPSPTTIQGLTVDCSLVVGETASFFELGVHDLGKYIFAAVTATNNFNESTSAISISSDLVTTQPTVIVVPTLSGEPISGSELHVSAGSWAVYPAADVTYQWYRCSTIVLAGDSIPSQCDEPIPGATTSAYLLTNSDSGKYVTAVVEYSNSVGSARHIASQTMAVLQSPILKTAPTLTGSATIGSTLTIAEGVWAGLPTASISYSWFACNQAHESIGSDVPGDCTSVSTSSGPTAVSAGFGHSCGIVGSENRLYCWGANSNGQLGDGSEINNLYPSEVPALQGVIAIDTPVESFMEHTCAVIVDGTVECWGWNGNGQLGDGTRIQRTNPVPVQGLTSATVIAVGNDHGCAIVSEGAVKCWGANGSGQLGDGTTSDRLTPVDVGGLSSAKSLAAGAGHTCALLQNQTVECWGSNWAGQLGTGDTFNSTEPRVVSTLTNIVDISAGWGHTCAVDSGGQVWCWGGNGDGTIGDGTTQTRLNPVSILTSSPAESISVGIYHSCAVLNNGQIQCWGANYDGQLGTGTANSSTIPAAVSGISNAISVSAGGYHTCAVLTTGISMCWGLNSTGQLGDGTTTNQSVPVKSLIPEVEELTTVLRITSNLLGKYITAQVSATNSLGTSSFVFPTTVAVTSSP